MIVLGIDPGITGGISVLHNGDLKGVYDMPVAKLETKTATVKRHVDCLALAELLRDLKREWVGEYVNVFIEKVGAMPGGINGREQGSASTFSLGETSGAIRGVVTALLRCEPKRVVPRQWKARFKLDGDKTAARARAAALFPDHAALFARVKDDGRAEAALIGLWGWEKVR